MLRSYHKSPLYYIRNSKEHEQAAHVELYKKFKKLPCYKETVCDQSIILAMAFHV